MKIFQRIILTNIIAFAIHLSTLAMDDSLSAERDRSIYFYRLEAPANNPSPAVYLLGGCHVIPITKLPEFVQNIFERCETFVTECSEIHLPGYFKIHLNNMKELGYAVTPESLVQMEIDSKEMTFGNEEYKNNFVRNCLRNIVQAGLHS